MSGASIKPGQEYLISDAEKQSREEIDSAVPAYMDQLDLTDEQKTRLSKEIMEEYDAIVEEYNKAGLFTKWKSLDNQYEGKVAQPGDQMFNLHKPTTKTKCDAVERMIKKAFFEVEPRFTVSPLPGYALSGGDEVCEKQQDYLDYKLDNDFDGIAFSQPLSKSVHNSIIRNGGIAAIDHEIVVEKKRREETYDGNPVYTVRRVDMKGQLIEADLTKKEYDRFIKSLINFPQEYEVTKIDNPGLKSFLSAYPDARERYPGYVTKLEDGKRVDIVVEYEEIVYNDPKIRNVAPSNFLVRLKTNGYDGLRTTRLIVEKQEYSWWDLKLEESNPQGKFQNIDELMYEYDKTDKTRKGGRKKKDKSGTQEKEIKTGYQNKTWTILRCTYFFNMDEKDTEPTRIVCWIDEESELVIGAIQYPYYSVAINYVPLFSSDKWDGFWQPGLAEYMTDLNLAENMMLNFTLEGVYTRNTITPITKNADILKQFLDKDFVHGIPLEANPNEVDFLQKYMAQLDTPSMISLIQILTRQQDDVTGVSSYTTGRESEIDPNAPASKTIALLKQSGIAIEEHILTMVPAFNKIADIILQITYQMAEEGGRKFKPSISGSSGSPFASISRDEMRARTNIQTQATAFALDKLNEKREDVALYGLVRQEPLVMRNPEGVYFLLKNIIKGWSPKWRNMIDKILPPLDKFKDDQKRVAVEAVARYVEAKAQQAQAQGGGQPQLDPMELIGAINDATSEQVTPPAPEVVEAREKAAQEGAMV